MATINVTRSSMPDYQEYCNEIKELWESHWLTNMGTKHKQLEQELQEFLTVQNITLFTNGHLALENILAAFCFPTGAEVITTPFTFVSTTHAIVRQGLNPIFCDIRPDNYTMDASKIEALITDKTVAIVPVHVYGNICDVETIQKIAEKHHLKVIYDAAHAFGITYKGINIANFGDASMFSFHATKVFNTIEGGAVCYSDASLKQTLNDLKNFGFHGPENVDYIGGNAKMNEFAAAMGICNLRHIKSEIQKRKRVIEHYNKRLKGVSGIILSVPHPEAESNYAYFPVVFDNYKYTRDEVQNKLSYHEIMARKYFYPLTNALNCYKGLNGFNPNNTPTADYISKRVLTLPTYADLSLEDVDRICDIILS